MYDNVKMFQVSARRNPLSCPATSLAHAAKISAPWYTCNTLHDPLPRHRSLRAFRLRSEAHAQRTVRESKQLYGAIEWQMVR